MTGSGPGLGRTPPGESLTGALAGLSGSRAEFRLRPVPPESLPFVPGLLAGAADIDLTPPPGLPRAGYSRNAHTGIGFRTRLRARVLHLRAGPVSLAIVATDLLGGSSIVQHLVALDVAADTDVPLAGLFLGATHTHGAPGQFHGSDFYNRYSSDGVGFDPVWTAFLARRIAAGVREAVAARGPARLAWGRAQVPGVTRNRALPAYRRNAGLAGASDPGAAVNPWLELLRVDRITSGEGAGRATEPLAALAVFSVHGTAVPMASCTYNADLWAYLVQELRERVAGAYGRAPVVAALQGTHGDVTPALHGPAGHPEARRVGAEIGAVGAQLYRRLDEVLAGGPRVLSGPPAAAGQPSPAGTRAGSAFAGRGSGPQAVPLAAGFRELDLAARTSAGGLRLPDRPAVGAALIAGAKENETPGITLVPPFRAGYGKRIGGRGPQGAKWVVGSRWLQRFILPLAEFPRVLPVHVVRIGEVLLTGIPMEVTTESGRRIAAAVEAGWRSSASGGGGAVRAVVSSVADEYAGYCTTSGEYGAQFYEGGHTLYGPLTQPYLAAAAGELAADLAGRPGGVVQAPLPQRDFRLRVHHYLDAPGHLDASQYLDASQHLDAPGRAPRPPSGTPESAGPSFRSRTGLERYLEWQWLDGPPGDLTWHEPLVAVVRGERTAPDVVLGDGTGDLEILHLGPDGEGRHRYAVRWYSPPPVRQTRWMRFAVHPSGSGEPLLSPPLR